MEINGKNYTLKYTLRSMFIWEEMVGRAFSIETLFDTYCFLYACILANEENPHLEFNEFIDACDADPSIITTFNQFLADEMKKREVLGKKKVTKKKKEEKN